MSKLNKGYTPAQTEAITYRGTDVLVSAAAGSGKTQVLTERIISIIAGEGVSIENLLAITFTKLAAAEMKERIKAALNAAYAETKSAFLRNEINKVEYADITTIDSFCSNLIKKYFYLLGVDPNFKILEEPDAEELKNQAVDNVFTELYEGLDEDFQSLLSVFSAHRKDAALRDAVKNVMNFCESEECSDKVLEKSLKVADEVKFKVDGGLLEEAKGGSQKLLSLLKELKNNEKYVSRKDKIEKYEAVASYYLSLNSVGEFDETAAYIKADNKLCGEVPELFEVIATLKGFYESFKETKPLILNSAEDLEFEKSLVIKLFNLVKRVEAEYGQLKAEAAAMTFSDLGKKTLELLNDKAVLEEIKNKYDYIFVDEYQDVNGVQEAIVNKISSDNCFMVGDLKQSIYGFRGSDPEYFKQKVDTFGSVGKKVINLDKNFRCAENIVEFVNDLFSNVMTENSCGVDYAKNLMEYGGLYGSKNKYEGEAVIDVYDDSAPAPAAYKGVYSVIHHDKLNKSKKNAGYGNLELAVVKLVENAVTQKYYDLKEPDENKKYKNIEYKDVAVIMGKAKGAGDRIVAALNEHGIPAFFESKETLTAYPEVKAIISLAEFLNLSSSDVPLAAAMLNFGGFTERELAVIRKAVADKKATFCDCVKTALTSKAVIGTVKNKISAFYAYMDKMRLFMNFGGAAETIRRIISDTGYDIKLLSLSGGKEKLKRINLLINGSDNSGKKSTICEFLDYVNANAQTISSAAETGENAVRIMTIHGSKGLEFPVVILCGTEDGFNYTDARGSVVLSRKYGVGVKTFNPDKMTVRDNIVRKFISDDVARGINREEIRKLYVALTRAKYRLHVLIGNNELLKIKASNKVKIDSQSKLLAASNAKINYVEDLFFDETGEGVAVAGNVVDENLAAAIRENLTYKYPYIADEALPVKSSVSKINEADEYYDVIDLSGDNGVDGTAAEVGTAYHRFLELADFYAPAKATFEKLIKDNKFAPARSELIDPEKLQTILSMPVFKEINGGRFLKELKFCALVSGEKLGYTGATDEVLVQGVADLISIKNGKATLIDYKYSAIKNDEDIIKKYKKQLELYKCAIENVLKTEVEKIYIVNVLQLKQICVSI